MIAPRTLGLVLLASLVPASAEPPVTTPGARPLPPAEHKTLDEFGETNPACKEWSDGCAVCLRRDDGQVGCSLPGIACVAGPVTCRPEMKTPPADKPNEPTPHEPTAHEPVAKEPPAKEVPRQPEAPKDAAPHAPPPKEPASEVKDPPPY